MSSSFSLVWNMFEKSSQREKIRYLLLASSYVIHTAYYACIPFLFYRPRYQCLNENDNSLFICSEEEACSSPHGYSLDTSENSQIQSISMKFNFFCDRTYQEAQMITMTLVGTIFSYLFLILFPIPLKNIYQFIQKSTLLIGILMFIILFFENIYVISIVLGIWSFVRTTFYGLIYAYCNAGFHGNIPKLTPPLYVNIFTFGSIFYICFAYVFGSWQHTIIYYCSIPYLFLSILLYLYQPIQEEIFDLEIGKQNNEEKLSSMAILKQRLKEIYSKKKYLKNAGHFVIVLSMLCFTWMGSVLILNQLAGNFFINQLSSQFIDCIFNIITVKLVLEHEQRLLVRIASIISGILMFIFVIVDSKFKNMMPGFGFAKIMHSMPIILSKGISEISWISLYQILSKILPTRHYQTIFSISNLFGSILMDLVPFYRYLMQKISVNQFIGYGIVSFICAFLATRFYYIDENEQELIENKDGEKENNQIQLMDLNQQKELQTKQEGCNLNNCKDYE